MFISYSLILCMSPKRSTLSTLFHFQTTQVTHQDGSNSFHFPNKQIEHHYKDGRKEISFPDGTKQMVFQDGARDTTFPDGMRLIDYPDGNQRVIPAS